MNTAGILYHQRDPAAEIFAGEVRHCLDACGVRAWALSAWDDDVPQRVKGLDLLICIGGDGSMLRAARIAIPHPIPILGIDMGRLAFLSELSAADALARIPDVVAGAGRIERRTMLRAEVLLPGGTLARDLPPQHALNDVVAGRLGGRPLDVQVHVDGVLMATIRADGVIVSTATGSTGYNLSAGGPVLWPEADEMVLTPVAAHLSRVRPIVLPADCQLELRVETDLRAILSFDGQVDYPLAHGGGVRVRRSEHIARFIRLGPPSDFYRNLTHLLDFDRRGSRE